MLWCPGFSDQKHLSVLGAVWDAMRDMLAHLEKLRTRVAEREMIRDLAAEKAKREMFDKLARHFEALANELEREIARIQKARPVDASQGLKTLGPFPKDEE
jgi:hypothetical protein